MDCSLLLVFSLLSLSYCFANYIVSKEIQLSSYVVIYFKHLEHLEHLDWLEHIDQHLE